jgi:hypothetical protein
MSKIKDLDQYLLFDKKRRCVVYNHDQPMSVTIPKYFKERGYFGTDPDSGNPIFLGVASVEIGEDNCALILPGILQTIPDEVEEKFDTIVLKYKKNNIFLVKDYIVHSTVDINSLFTSFIVLGKPVSYLPYLDFIKIFDHVTLITGKTFGQRIDYELLLAESTRDVKDLNKRYRHCDQSQPHRRISIRNVAYGPSSITGKLGGGYFNDGLNSALLMEDDGLPTNKIEALLKS